MSATIQTCLRRSELLAAVSDSARLDAEILLAWVLGKDRTYLFTWPERTLSAAEQAAFERALQRRAAGEPVAYIIGTRDFWTLTLKVSDATLIPRPETELLVEQVLARENKHEARVLDLGTGTGAVALAIASEKPAWAVSACDLMPAAVALAEENCRDLNLNNVRILQSNWYAAVAAEVFDVIVSNPPYIDATDPHLQQGDVRFEPRTALVADAEGLADIVVIVKGGRDHLSPGGWLALEHGYQQAAAVRAVFAEAGYHSVESVCDLAGHERVTLGYWY